MPVRPVLPLIGELKSSPLCHRNPNNPVLKSADVPYPSTLVFNAGVTKFQGQYVMVFRNDFLENFPQSREHKICLGLATSPDGVKWSVAPKPCFHIRTEEILRVYDPRLTVIDGRVYMCYAIDTRHGLRGGIAVTDDFEKWEVLHMTVPDNRNMVLFPEKIGGHYVRLERPFPVYSSWGAGDRFDIWLSESPDLVFWGKSDLVLDVEHVPFSNDKIGPAAPPIRTDKCWLTIIHAVDIDKSRGKNGWEAKWQKRYTAGVMALDLEDPRKVIGLCKEPLLAPEAPYETTDGWRNNVIFPCGAILEDSGEVKIYYGSADTTTCLATADIHDLVKMCGL